MKVLSIGNSFSQDAQRYLHKLSKFEGVDIKTVNLYIGGCSLRTHYLNILENNRDYKFEFNGEDTGIKVSINEALASDDWDYVTIQQASHFSGIFDSYSPYIEYISSHVKKYVPKAKIIIHQTWPYEDGCDRMKNLTKFTSTKEMFLAICDAYSKANKLIKADGFIPCGEALMKAHELGIEKVHRDTFHASLGAGRYLLALCWFKVLTGKDITNNRFNDFDVPVTDEEREIVIKAVNSIIK